MEGAVKVIKSDLKYKGRLIHLQVDTLKSSSGTEMIREILVHPGASVIIPCLEPERFILVKQYRHAAERNLWEFPAGTLEAGESTEECARRELREEAGYSARAMKPILSFFSSPGISQEKMFLFLAEDLELVDEHPLEAAEIYAESKSLADLERMVGRGEIVDAKTIIGVYYLLQERKVG